MENVYKSKLWKMYINQNYGKHEYIHKNKYGKDMYQTLGYIYIHTHAHAHAHAHTHNIYTYTYTYTYTYIYIQVHTMRKDFAVCAKKVLGRPINAWFVALNQKLRVAFFFGPRVVHAR
jgi:hypothetical protein